MRIENLLQGVSRERLDEVVVKAGLLGSTAVVILAPAGLSHKESIAKAWLPPKPAGDFVAVHSRQANVDQHNGRSKLIRCFERFWPRLGNVYLVSHQLQKHAQTL